MNDKHNLDRLFQEKFKDFEVTPPEFVWENIEDALREKKKRRVIPLWIKLSGVAAVLVIGSIFTVPYLNGLDTNDNPVVIEKNGGKRISPTNDPIPNNGKIIVDSTLINSRQNSAVASEEAAGDKKDAAHTGNGKKLSTAPKPAGKAFDDRNDAVAHGGKATPSATGRNNGGKRGVHKTLHPQGHAAEGVAQNHNTGSKNRSGKTASGNANANGTDVIQPSTGSNGNTQNAVVAGTDGNNSAKQGGSKDPLSPANAGNGNSIIKKDLPVEEAIAGTPVDTTAAPVEENPLEKMLQDKLKGKQDEEKMIAENSNKGKWNIKPQVAPVFYNSLSGGSPIDGQFAGNSKSFDNDLSYGVGIDYAVTDRLSVRSGINTVNLSYATNDIQFRASLSGNTNNVSARARSANIIVQTASQPELGPHGPIVLEPSSFSNQQVFDGSMIQKTGYIEVPVEMSYALVNKKFGIDVIGGVSTLFLNENNVSVVSAQGYSTEVGEAQNLNSVHFSTNIGVGFKYRFWKSFQANFEPTFKYQVNAYSRDAGNFKPYFIGLYSGISFSF